MGAGYYSTPFSKLQHFFYTQPDHNLMCDETLTLLCVCHQSAHTSVFFIFNKRIKIPIWSVDCAINMQKDNTVVWGRSPQRKKLCISQEKTRKYSTSDTHSTEIRCWDLKMSLKWERVIIPPDLGN